MARRRFYAPPESIEGLRITLSTDETHHLTNVLRLKPGSEALVFDGRGSEYRCRFLAAESGRARLEIIDTLDDTVESSVRLTLAQAMAKGEKFDLIIQKATELGVSSIVPLITEHTDVKPDREQSFKRLDRWRRISLEALKQSGRRKLVEITAPLALEEFLLQRGGLESRGTLLVFSERGGAPLSESLVYADDAAVVTAIVGPEGGWSQAELELLSAHGAKAVTLGPRVLRTETAAIVAVALIQHAVGDLSRAASGKPQ
jgi:16S rRNA (uracil1498-N3)-methyltransferase